MELVEVDSVRDLSKRGYRWPILQLAADGFKPGEIAEQLTEQYGLKVSDQLVGIALSSWGGRGEILQAAVAHERREHQQRAKETMEWMREGYMDAVEEEDVGRMKFFMKHFGKWWDRYGKFFLKADQVPEVLQQNTIIKQQNTLNILVEELEDNPDAAERVIERLEDEGPASSGWSQT